MSWRLMDRVCALKLPPVQEQILMRMAQRAADDGTHCHPGIQELMDRTGRPERSVRRIVGELEQAGYIQAVAYRRGGRGMSTEWRLCLETLPPVAPIAPEETLPPVAENPATGGTESTKTLPPVAENPATGGTPIDQEDQYEVLDQERSVVRAPRGPATKRAREVKPLTEQGIVRLIGAFADRLGGESEVRERIEEALANDAARKWTDMYLYVRGWLRRDAVRARTPVVNLTPKELNKHATPD